MSQPDAIDVLLQIVESALQEKGSPSKIRGAVAALAAIGDNRATDRLMELADRTGTSELAEAATREICDMGKTGAEGEVVGYQATKWILRDGGQSPLRRWQAAVRAISNGARADLRQLGFRRSFGLAFRGAGGLPRNESDGSALSGMALFGALLSVPTFFFAATRFAEGGELFGLAAMTLLAALVPAVFSALVFFRMARMVPWAAGGWGFVAAEATRIGLVAFPFVIAVAFILESANWAFDFSNRIEATEHYGFAVALTGLSTVACICVGRVSMVLLGDDGGQRLLTRLCSFSWAAASGIILSFVGASAVMNGASFILPVFCSTIAATATLTFGTVKAVVPPSAERVARKTAGFGPRQRRHLITATGGIIALSVTLAALIGRVGVSGMAAEERASNMELFLSRDLAGQEIERDIPICSTITLRAAYNQPLNVDFRTEDQDIVTRVEDGASRWEDNDFSGTNTERQTLKATAGDEVRLSVSRYEFSESERESCIEASNEFDLFSIYPMYASIYSALAANVPNNQGTSLGGNEIPLDVVHVSVSSELSADVVQRMQDFEAFRAEMDRRKDAEERDDPDPPQDGGARNENDADQSIPVTGFVVLLDELRAGGASSSPSSARSPQGSTRTRTEDGNGLDRQLEPQRLVASAGSVFYVYASGSGTATVNFVAGRGEQDFRGMIPLDELLGLAFPLTPENAEDKIASGLAWSRLRGNAKELNYSGHPALEDIRAGRLALASLSFLTDSDSRTSGATRAILRPGSRAGFVGMVTILQVETDADMFIAPSRGWWTAAGRPEAACLIVPRYWLQQSLLFPLDGRSDNLVNAVMDDLRDLYGEEWTLPVEGTENLDTADCERLVSERIYYSEDNNEEGLFEIILSPSEFRPIGGLEVDSSTLGLASDGGRGRLYASLWRPLAEVELLTNGEAEVLTELGDRGAEGLAFDDVTGSLYASRGKEFFVYDVESGNIRDVFPENAVEWEDAECLAIDTVERRIYAISGRDLWAFDIERETFKWVADLRAVWTDCGLAYSPQAGHLIAFGNEELPGALWSLDPGTGAVEVIFETERILRGGLTILP